MHGFERLEAFGGLGVQPSVVVLGTGPVGLYALAMSIASGAALTVSIGAPAQRIQLAQAWGATHTIHLEEVKNAQDRIELVRQWTGGRGADLVIEAAGPVASFEDGLAMVRRGGRILVIGQSTKNTIPFSPRRLRPPCIGG